jgi:hypothetical protein
MRSSNCKHHSTTTAPASTLYIISSCDLVKLAIRCAAHLLQRRKMTASVWPLKCLLLAYKGLWLHCNAADKPQGAFNNSVLAQTPHTRVAVRLPAQQGTTNTLHQHATHATVLEHGVSSASERVDVQLTRCNSNAEAREGLFVPAHANRVLSLPLRRHTRWAAQRANATCRIQSTHLLQAAEPNLWATAK